MHEKVQPPNEPQTPQPQYLTQTGAHYAEQYGAEQYGAPQCEQQYAQYSQPHSQPCVALQEQYHILPEGVTLAQIRKLSGKLPPHPAHSFFYRGKWKSHSVEACLRTKKTLWPG